MHWAVLDGEKSGPGKCACSIGTMACAWHGCFCPGSLVDFPKGEKQMSMDYSVSEGIKTTHMQEIEQMALIYDVVCEYGVHMIKRFLEHPGLTLPTGLEIIKAIGLFHVHGHQDECLHRYAMTYIPGLGMIDGEILETLWAVLNKIARSTCGATIAHRTEVLDDHMGDSNWKKIINIGGHIRFSVTHYPNSSNSIDHCQKVSTGSQREYRGIPILRNTYKLLSCRVDSHMDRGHSMCRKS